MVIHHSRIFPGFFSSFCGSIILSLLFMVFRSEEKPDLGTALFGFCILLPLTGASIYLGYRTFRPLWIFRSDGEYLWARYYVRDKDKCIGSKWITSKIKLASIKFVYTHEVEVSGSDGDGYGQELVIKTDEETCDMFLAYPLEVKREKLVKMIESEVARARSTAEAQAQPSQTLLQS